MKIHNKKELKQTGINHSTDIDCRNFLKIYRNNTNEPFFFTIDTTLHADNPMRFRNNFLNSPL